MIFSLWVLMIFFPSHRCSFSSDLFLFRWVLHHIPWVMFDQENGVSHLFILNPIGLPVITQDNFSLFGVQGIPQKRDPIRI